MTEMIQTEGLGKYFGEMAAVHEVNLTLREGRKWKAYMEDVYRRFNGDIDAAAKATNDYFYKEMPGYFIASDILEGVFKGMYKYISKNI